MDAIAIMGLIFGVSGFTFGMMGFIFNAVSTSKINKIEKRLEDLEKSS